MFWELTQDAPGRLSLLSAARQELGEKRQAPHFTA